MTRLSELTAQRSVSRARPSPALPAFAALTVYAVALFMPQVLGDGDTYWHLAAGDWMLAQGELLRTDPFSFTRAGAPWQTHEWLSEILMAAAFRAAGWSGLVLLIASAAALATGLLAAHLGRWLEPPARLVVLALAVGCLAPSLLARPHILALPVLEIWVAMLLIAREEGRAPSLFMLPVMTLWANLHGSFALGLVLIAPFALEACVEDKWRAATLRAWALFACGAVLAALITPHGVSGLLFPLTLMTMKSLSAIAEWRSTDFSTLQPLELALMTALFVFLTRGVRLPVIRLVTLLALLHMSLQHGRHQMVLGFVGALIVAATLSEAQAQKAKAGAPAVGQRASRGWSLLGVALSVALAIFRLASPVERVDGPHSPVSALAHVPNELSRRPVFNEYGFGGYLIFGGVRPFIDGRADLFGDAFLSDYARITHPDAEAFDAAVLAYGIEWTLLSPGNPLVALLDVRPGWRRLYADGFAVVHVADGPIP